jgi:bifunctional DNA-binding transcriptional regulator/antitoxin component of YhaV-PrlF toxin-antitoxin module
MEIIKLRPAWSGTKGRGGCIITIPKAIRTEAGVQVGDCMTMTVMAPGEIRIRKIQEE